MGEEKKVMIEIRKMYISNSSIEVPNSPAIFANNKLKPSVNLNGVHQVEKLPEDNFYLVKLRLRLDAEDEDTKEKIYHIDVVECGIFEIHGLSGEQLDHALNVYAPTTLYPYAREVVSTSLVRAGFKSVYLQPINFEAVYANQKKKKSGNVQ